jgi:type III secretion protein L
MLCRQKIELHKDASGLPRTLISRETLAGYAQANQVLSRAKAQAHELLRLAEEKREDLLENAGIEFWQRADAQLKRWESERGVLCDNLERYATAVVSQAIRCLLEEATPSQRLAALLKQLLASQVPAVKATLLCHPLELEDVKQGMANHVASLWELRPDDTIKPQTLVLKTDEGDFRIDWFSMLDALLKNSDELAKPR